MVTSTQFTTPGTSIVPASINQQTDLAALPGVVDAYHAMTGGTVALDTITQVVDAMRDASAVVVKYVDGKGDLDARALWPTAVSVTKDAHLVCRAYCTLRREWRTFRLDRMVAVHALTTPDDAAPQGAPAPPPAPDPVKIATRLGATLTTLMHSATLDAADSAMLTDAIDDARRLYKAVAVA